MRVLGIDTATAACSAALWADGAVLARRSEAMERGHAEALLPMVVEVMSEAGGGFGRLDLVAATVGPGAFTGLRVGLAAARGLALACGRPCIGVTTLEAVAAGARAGADGPRGRTLLVALRSRRAELYVQTFDDAGVATRPPSAVLAEALPGMVAPPVLVVGDAGPEAAGALAAAGVDAAIGAAPGVADPGVVAAIAASRRRDGADLPPPAPLYLRPPDAVRPKDGGRLRP